MIARIVSRMDTTNNPGRRAHTLTHATLQRLFRYKAWANDELLKALTRLDAGLGDAAPITLLAVKALSHTLIVDRIFAAHLRRASHEYTSANADALPTLADLATAIRASDLEYVDYVETLCCDELTERIEFTFTDGASGCMTREEMLMHVITHGVGHRGQISAVMLLNSQPPATDGFTAYLHRAEAATRRQTLDRMTAR
jgi:uncharacterized damage-inducible protein DinB